MKNQKSKILPGQTDKIQNSGFSLIELLVTSAIIAVLMGLVLVIFIKGTSLDKVLDNTASQIVASLREAQSRSISQQDLNYWGVYFDNSVTTTPYFIIFEGQTYSPTTTTSNKVGLSNVLNFSLPANGSGLAIVFDKLTGRPISSATSTTISAKVDSSKFRTININSVGQVNIVSSQ